MAEPVEVDPGDRPCTECGKPCEPRVLHVRACVFYEAQPCPDCQRRLNGADARLFEQLTSLGINVPARGRHPLSYVLDAIDDQEAAGRVRAWYATLLAAGPWEPVRGLILEGPTGVGKSWIACAAVRSLLERRHLAPSDVIYDSSKHVWGSIKSGYGDGTAASSVRARQRVRLWVLDDLGIENANDDTAANLTEILTARELRPTIITANLPRDDLGDRYDPVVWDRVKSRLGDRNFEVIQVLGDDHRVSAA